MIAMIRATAKLCIVSALAAFLPIAPSHAQTFAFVSANGSGSACTAALPCASVAAALGASVPPVRVICVDGSAQNTVGIGYPASNVSVDIDCPQGSLYELSFSGANATARIRHLAFPGSLAFGSQLIFTGSGTLILEDCAFADAPSTVLDVEPNGQLNIVIKYSRISNSASGILFKPQAGGSIKATLDHVTITDNSGGGVKADSTNGAVNLDVTDSEISNNNGNGINAVAGTSLNIVNIKNSVIARNGAAGVQANGANAGVLLQTTLLDQNVAGATSIVSGGNMFTYGNNSIVGSAGSGFNHSAELQ
jgi:hypothetical protein